MTDGKSQTTPTIGAGMSDEEQVRISRACNPIEAFPKSKTINCAWTQDSDGDWDTACGNRFAINEGLPSENDMRFCCYCGNPLHEVQFAAPSSMPWGEDAATDAALVREVEANRLWKEREAKRGRR